MKEIVSRLEFVVYYKYSESFKIYLRYVATMNTSTKLSQNRF